MFLTTRAPKYGYEIVSNYTYMCEYAKQRLSQNETMAFYSNDEIAKFKAKQTVIDGSQLLREVFHETQGGSTSILQMEKLRSWMKNWEANAPTLRRIAMASDSAVVENLMEVRPGEKSTEHATQSIVVDALKKTITPHQLTTWANNNLLHDLKEKMQKNGQILADVKSEMHGTIVDALKKTTTPQQTITWDNNILLHELKEQIQKNGQVLSCVRLETQIIDSDLHETSRHVATASAAISEIHGNIAKLEIDIAGLGEQLGFVEDKALTQSKDLQNLSESLNSKIDKLEHSQNEIRADMKKITDMLVELLTSMKIPTPTLRH